MLPLPLLACMQDILLLRVEVEAIPQKRQELKNTCLKGMREFSRRNSIIHVDPSSAQHVGSEFFHGFSRTRSAPFSLLCLAGELVQA